MSSRRKRTFSLPKFSIKRKSSLNFRRRRKQFDFIKFRNVLLTALEVAVVVGVAYLLVISFGKQVECANASMEPTYCTKDVLLINSLAYKFSEPEQGDVIAFKPHSNVNASYSIKRVIAGPGDTIYIKNGRIYINGEKFNETQKFDAITNPGIASSELTLLDDQYFVLGDNRNSSEDSRFESIGFISKNDILGKVWVKYPFKKG